MVTRTALLLSVLGPVLIGVLSGAFLPNGNSGIAARYPFDAGIASDPAVIFADDFESYRDALFLRYYARFDSGFNVLGSSHNGSTVSARYCCPGVRADGFNKFLVSYE